MLFIAVGLTIALVAADLLAVSARKERGEGGGLHPDLGRRLR